MSANILRLPRRLDADSHAAICAAANIIATNPVVDTIDASATEFIGALGAAMIACAAASRAQPIAKVVPPRKGAARRFAEQTHLWDTVLRPLLPGAVQFSSDTLAVRQLRALDPTYTTALAELLGTHVAGVSDSTSHLVQLCLNEALQNVFEHAHSSVGCFVLARWHKKVGNLRLAVVDRGRGIAAALRDVPTNRDRADADLVRDAVTVLGVTSRANRVGGLGLKTIRDIVVAREGRILVSTGDTWLAASAKGVSVGPAARWDGTAIEIDFRPAVLVADSDEEQVF
ncbi:MAG: ATP-binding protein [Polyangiales bacterium]